MKTRGWKVLLAVASALAVPSFAAAQAPATQFVEQEADRPSDEETLLAFSAGGTLNTGNTRSMTLNIGATFSLKRARHMIAAAAGASFGRAALRDPMTGSFAAYTTNAETFTGRLRYDFFITDDDSLFAVLRATRDRFAGLDSRLQGQLGYMRNFFLEKRTEEQGGGTHRLWGEIGYDITLDNYYPNPLLGPMMMVLPGDDVVHSARAYVGYQNSFNEEVSLTTGAEVLMNLEDPEDTRLEWISSLESTVSEALKLKLDFTLRFDNQPVTGKDRLDTATVLNAVFSLDLAPAPPPEPEPAADEPAADEPAADAPAADAPPADAPPADAPPADAPAPDAAAPDAAATPAP